MEADWEFEIGGDAPVIEGTWSGFVDLRADPARAVELVECSQLPALANALIKLNGATSSYWTSKTDVFVPDHIDPDELDASGDSFGSALACYIDLLPRDDQRWGIPGNAESDCKQICNRLHLVKLHGCRVDLVIRGAFIESDVQSLGVTAYSIACGRDMDDAKTRLAECLEVFVDALVRE